MAAVLAPPVPRSSIGSSRASLSSNSLLHHSSNSSPETPDSVPLPHSSSSPPRPNGMVNHSAYPNRDVGASNQNRDGSSDGGAHIPQNRRQGSAASLEDVNPMFKLSNILASNSFQGEVHVHRVSKDGEVVMRKGPPPSGIFPSDHGAVLADGRPGSMAERPSDSTANSRLVGLKGKERARTPEDGSMVRPESGEAPRRPPSACSSRKRHTPSDSTTSPLHHGNPGADPIVLADEDPIPIQTDDDDDEQHIELNVEEFQDNSRNNSQVELAETASFVLDYDDSSRSRRSLSSFAPTTVTPNSPSAVQPIASSGTKPDGSPQAQLENLERIGSRPSVSVGKRKTGTSISATSIEERSSSRGSSFLRPLELESTSVIDHAAASDSGGGGGIVGTTSTLSSKSKGEPPLATLRRSLTSPETGGSLSVPPSSVRRRSRPTNSRTSSALPSPRKMPLPYISSVPGEDALRRNSSSAIGISSAVSGSGGGGGDGEGENGDPLDASISLRQEAIRRDREVKRWEDSHRTKGQVPETPDGENGFGVAASASKGTPKPLTRSGSKDKEKVLVGNLIGEGHANYVLMYNMLTGIRIGVSRCEAKLNRPLQDSDYTARHKYSFDIVGNELAPSSRYDFKFKDYAPWVFRHLREYFHLDPADYLLSLTAKYILSELGSPGKSGSFFYFSRDYRFIIKTIHRSEHKFLRKILKRYHEHVKENPHTLLSRFYGLHRVKLPHGRKIHFVIMNNLFPPHRDIHETYDLKGSAIGREYPEDKAATKKGAVLKDLNWVHRNRHIELGPEKRAYFEEQLRRDTELLQLLGIMDYSLLIGLHDVGRGNQDNLRDVMLTVFSPETGKVRRKPTQVKKQRQHTDATALRKAVERSDPKSLSHTKKGLPEQEGSERRHFLFYQDEGGLRATDENNEPTEMFYYLGIIDILTPYSLVKRGEHFWKGLKFDKHMISAVPPKEYGDRFMNFLFSVMRGGDESRRPKME